jgi:hypothetical protein
MIDDILYENPKLDVAILHYSIAESSMCFYSGFLAIFENKENPRLVLSIKNGKFTNMKIFFSANGNLAFAKSALYNGGWPIFIFDLLNQSFAYFKTITNNICYDVIETNNNDFTIVADEWQMKDNPLLQNLNGTKIKIDTLTWMPFREIDSFFTQLRNTIKQANQTIV